MSVPCTTVAGQRPRGSEQRGESMSRLRKIAEIPAGRWTKWLVVGIWLVVMVLAFPLSSKLTGAEKNDASAWLPGGAESTKVLDVQSHFQSPNVYPGVVVYARTSGLTATDRAKAAADARMFAGLHDVVPGQVIGPIPSADGKALETILKVDLGTQGWSGAAKAVDAMRAITNSNANGLVSHITGPLGNAADSNNVFKGIDGTLLYSALAVVIVILLITYRSPVPWLLPVISSGLALLTLFAAELNSTKDLGPVLAIGVAVAMLAMLTLLPALMVIFPRGVFWPYRPSYGSAEPTARGIWARVGWSIAPRPRLIWITTAVVLGILALGLTGLKAHGLTSAQGFRGHPDSVIGETVLAAHFPAGAGEPVIVIGNANATAPLRSALAATPGIADVTPAAVRAGHAYLEGTLTAPPDSQAAYATIDRVRSAVHAVPGAAAEVGGSTAINLDVERASGHDRNVIIPLILVVVLIILGLLLRSLVAPLILTATVVLSFAAALGVSSFFFDHVFGFGGADTSFPLFVFVFLVALGIDYNIFLMTRVREEAIRRDARRGALIGLAATGGVITSAGFVLAGTFAALATIPATFLTELGFAVAFGILLDTIIVRSVLVTALNLDLGRWMWWPSALAHKPDPAPGELSQERAAATVPS